MVQSKWNEFVSQKYEIYYQGKVAEWDKATRRMDAAAHVGNKIAEGTLFIIVIRETGNFGPEFFFSKDVFPFFQIK